MLALACIAVAAAPVCPCPSAALDAHGCCGRDPVLRDGRADCCPAQVDASTPGTLVASVAHTGARPEAPAAAFRAALEPSLALPIAPSAVPCLVLRI
jgi:hypothetical protein